MMLGLGGLRNPLIIGQMMEQPSALNHMSRITAASSLHHVMTPVSTGLVIGFLARNGVGGDDDRKRCGCLNPAIFRVICDTLDLIGRSGKVEPTAYVLVSRSS